MRAALRRWSRSGAVLVALLSGAITVTRPARADGIEYPDNGVEAMGRGAAFTAKADDGTALIYNVAGFARQRGWRLTVGANVAFHSASFQRAGTYPDNGSDPLTPWGGQRFPLVQSTGPPQPIPHLMLSTDLGLDRFTFAAGLYTPSVLGGRVFPVGVQGKPSPSRYDAVKSGGVIAYPSLAMAARVTRWLDVGLAGNLVIANLEAHNVSSVDLAPAVCPNQEYQPCDSRQRLSTKGTSLAFTAGAMVRPVPWLAAGLQFRTPFTLETEGTVTPTPPAVQPAPIVPGRAFITQAFPWVLRGGVRYISLRDKFEVWDVEMDATYEAWGSALGEGTKVYIPKLSIYENIRSTVRLNFEDTMSFRGGGAFNIPVGPRTTVTVRAGLYYDMAATKPASTRLMFDTLAKTGITLGAGAKVGAFTINLAVAKVFHERREVSDGVIRPLNGARGARSVSSSGELYAPVNNGVYESSTFVLALGLGVQIEELFGPRRVPSYGAEYETTSPPAPLPSSEAPPAPPGPVGESPREPTPAVTTPAPVTAPERAGDPPPRPASSEVTHDEAPSVAADAPPSTAESPPPPTKKPAKPPRKRRAKPRP